MTITETINGGRALVRIDGNIDSDSGHDLSVKLMELMEVDGLSHVAFDLSTVNTVTSSAIGKLLNFFKFMNSKEGSMEIKGISETLLNQFREIHLDRIFPISQ